MAKVGHLLQLDVVGLERRAERLLDSGHRFVEVQPGNHGALLGVSQFVLPGQHQEVGGFAVAEQPDLTIEFLLRGPRARLRRLRRRRRSEGHPPRRAPERGEGSRHPGRLRDQLRAEPSVKPLLSSQPLTICTRSRLPLSGSLSAHTAKVGAFAPFAIGGRSLPIGTPCA